MIRLGVLYAAAIIDALCLLFLTCMLIDRITDAAAERRRRQRLKGSTVVRLPLPSPNRRGERVPRLAAVSAPRHRIRG